MSSADLAKLHEEGNDLLSDLRTVETALMSPFARLHYESIASTLGRSNARLLELLDRLEALAGRPELDTPIALVPTTKAPKKAARSRRRAA